MDAKERLLEDIRDAPDDDAPRLVWADAVGGERGEFVVIQCELASGALAPRDAIARRKRQRELLVEHGAAWSGLAGIATRVSFSRGFVDAAQITGRVFVRSADAIREAAPLLSAVAFDAEVAELVEHPLFRSLAGVSIDGASGDLVIEQLARAGVLARLRAFGMRTSGRGRQGVGRLLGERSLPWERMHVAELLHGDALASVLARLELPALRAIDLGDTYDVGAALAVLPATVRELHAARLGDAELELLARSPIAAHLERLVLASVNLRSDARHFAAFPRLRALTIFGGTVEERALRALRSNLPELRELAIIVLSASREALRDVASALGPQLALLDLRNNATALRYLNELRTHVAGELLVGSTAGPFEPLLRVGSTIQMPWWDHVTLR